MNQSLSDISRAMPFSEDAEKGVLSCLMQNPGELLNDSQNSIPSEAFYHPAHRGLYDSLLEMNSKGKPVDLVSISQYLIDKGVLDKFGGPGLIAELYSFVPTTAHYEYYASIMVDKKHQRDGVSICTSSLAAMRSIQDGEMAAWSASLVENAIALQEKTLGLKQNSGRSYRELLTSVVETASNGSSSGPAFGLPWLDQQLGGALPGRLYVVAGGTSDGKSALALQMVCNLALNGHAGSIFSLEMPVEEVMQRIASTMGRVRSQVWMGGSMNKGEMEKFASFTRQDLPITFYDELDGIEEIAGAIRIDKALKNISWAVIDYAQLCTTKGNSNNREREVASISRTCKRLANKLGITVILLSQLNDDGKLRESRAIGQDADKIIRLETTKNESERLLRILKNRGGQRNLKILMEFDGQYYFFREKGE